MYIIIYIPYFVKKIQPIQDTRQVNERPYIECMFVIVLTKQDTIFI